VKTILDETQQLQANQAKIVNEKKGFLDKLNDDFGKVKKLSVDRMLRL
jgi:hypothetical protein